MYCPNCGNQIDDNAAVCLNCGISTDRFKAPQEKKPSAGWWWLGFFLPIVGFLIWALCSDTPKKARKAGMGAIVGMIVSILLVVLFYVLYFIFIFWAMSESMSMDAVYLSL